MLKMTRTGIAAVATRAREYLEICSRIPFGTKQLEDDVAFLQQDNYNRMLTVTPRQPPTTNLSFMKVAVRLCEMGHASRVIELIGNKLSQPAYRHLRSYSAMSNLICFAVMMETQLQFQGARKKYLLQKMCHTMVPRDDQIAAWLEGNVPAGAIPYIVADYKRVQLQRQEQLLARVEAIQLSAWQTILCQQMRDDVDTHVYMKEVCEKRNLIALRIVPDVAIERLSGKPATAMSRIDIMACYGQLRNNPDLESQSSIRNFEALPYFV